MGAETTGSRATAKSRNRLCRRAESLPSTVSKMAAFQSKAGNEMKSWFARGFKLKRRRRLRLISWREKSGSKPPALAFTPKAPTARRLSVVRELRDFRPAQIRSFPTSTQWRHLDQRRERKNRFQNSEWRRLA